MDLTTIYLLTILPDIGHALIWWSFLGFVVSAFALIIFWIAGEEAASYDSETRVAAGKRYFRGRNIAITCVAFFVGLNLVANAVPDRKQMLIIAGMYFGSNIEGIKDLPPNIVKAVNSALEQFSEKKKDQ